MAQRSVCKGRPRKYREGWEKSQAKIYITKDTLEKWRELRKKLDFASDNLVAIYLLQQNEELTVTRREEITDSQSDR